MTHNIREVGTALKEHKGKVGGVVGGGSIGLAGLYFMFQQMIAPLPTVASMLEMELRITKNFDERMHVIEKNMNDSSIAYLEALSKLGAKFDAHEKNFDFLRRKVESHHRRGPSAHSPN